jgi:hypothetical protein
MTRIRVIGVTLAAMFALGALAASSAAASEGPVFLGPSGEEHLTLHELSLGDFTLKPTSFPTILCEHLSAATLALAGGKSDTTIHYTSCTATGSGGSGACDALNKGGTPGSILFPAKSELVYTGAKAEAEKEEGPLGDLITPESGTTFVTLTFEALGTGTCPTGAVEEKLTGSVIGAAEPLNTMSAQGMLTFPSTTIKTGFQWLSKGKVDKVTAGLEVFGIKVTQIGLADLVVEGGGEWGVLSA